MTYGDDKMVITRTGTEATGGYDVVVYAYVPISLYYILRHYHRIITK